MAYSLSVPPLKHLKEAVQRLREDRKLTLDQLAVAAGFGNRQRLAEALRGNPSAKTIDRILDALGADLYDLAQAVDVVTGNDKGRESERQTIKRLEKVVLRQAIELGELREHSDGPNP